MIARIIVISEDSEVKIQVFDQVFQPINLI